MGRRSTVMTELPREVRAWLDKALIDSNFTGYEALEAALGERGYTISKSAIHRYGQPLQRRLAAIKASTEAAKILTEGADDSQDALSGAVIALVQTGLFETIVNLQEATDEDVDPAERVKLLSTAAKNIATLSRASVNLKKFQSEVREKALQEAASNVEAAARAQGMGEDQVRFWREKVLGVC